jgi:hypothetical protein
MRTMARKTRRSSKTRTFVIVLIMLGIAYEGTYFFLFKTSFKTPNTSHNASAQSGQPVKIQDKIALSQGVESKEEDTPVKVEDSVETKTEDTPVKVEDSVETKTKTEDTPVKVEDSVETKTKTEDTPVKVEDSVETKAKTEDTPVKDKTETTGTSHSADSEGSIKWDSSKSAVLALASGYQLNTYKSFVGGLRATGYPGHIILGISEDATSDVIQYLAEQNVTTKVVTMAKNCTYDGAVGHDGKVINTRKWHCPAAYPDYKITWARFLLYKDWLNDCPECTDGVMLTDARDAFFQKDPFQSDTIEMHPLMLFEEHQNMTTENWLADFPISVCKDHKLGAKPMLCSGSVMGSREGIIDYIDAMGAEFIEWKDKDNCRIDLPGDDQSIHNYLYYTNKLKNARAYPHRTGPIHVIGFEAAGIYKKAEAESEEQGMELTQTPSFYVKDKKWNEWLPQKFGNITDPKTGLITNMDGTISAQVHQYDRFGGLISGWLNNFEDQGWSLEEKE